MININQKTKFWLNVILYITIFSNHSLAQNSWPREILTDKGVRITIYQPQPEKFQNNILRSRAAISIEVKPGTDLIFGAFWSDAKLTTDRTTRMAELESIRITDVRFPDVTDTAHIQKLKTILETEIPKWNLQISIDALVASIDSDNPNAKDELKNDPPEIIYSKKSTYLVFIDGEPKTEMDENMKMDRVINSASLIVKSTENKKYYLYGGQWWYESDSVKTGWKPSSKLPSAIKQIDKSIKEKEAAKEKPAEDEKTKSKTPPEIIVRMKPAELIQTEGDAKMAAVEGTGLLYATNTSDNIFLEISSQKYFILISGRWYKSSSLNGPWQYNDADSLPPEFSKIPEGSEKDNVLASVGGTMAAKEAVMDAQIPQTAKVDRKTATCTVKYDGEPTFEKIEGTSLSIAKNTSSTVLMSNQKYYCVENGIWFVSTKATGPWSVSDERPKDVDKIPADNPAYNVKYVYVYESTPEVVYVGYTPGYMGCYVYGPTVVYGTGYYYSPWYGPYYYPHPVTYGFAMSYNPYMGWSMGFHVSVGFHYGYGGYGGYWGPHGYHPPYHGHPPHGGYYGPHGGRYGNTNINIDNSNNFYNNRNGVNTRDINRGQGAGNRPSTQPAGGNRPSTQPAGGGNRPSTQPAGGGNRPSTQPAGASPSQRPANNNNVLSDKNGNVYRQNGDGDMQQRSNNQWQNSNKQQPATNDMNRQQQMRDRGQTRDNNFNNSNYGGGRSAQPRQNMSRPSGGGGRRR